ncbi:unnamed protein product [Peronospora belbahrii]|uniref:DUSP domain-containing protein n=1 Tax=Peronospora belbahrii TaxID=622444 RepID=A0ABN8CR45_9STRA|nr:unnamed protein product [Peronospora belbahrii]
MELTPRHDQPLLVPGSATLEAMSTPCVVSVRVVAAVELLPMHKGIISNAMVEVSLLHTNGSNQFCHSMGNDHKNVIFMYWVDTDSVIGVLFTVRHIEKFGLVKKDIGQLVLSLRDIMELKLQLPHEQTFHLQSTEKMIRRDALEASSNRKSGKLIVRSNGYGVPTSYTVTTNGRVSNMVNTLVTHEDEFGRSSKSLVVHDIRAEVRKLQGFHQTKPKPGEMWFAVNADWVHAWLLFVSKYKGEEDHNPGTVDNMPLISDDLSNGTFQIKKNLVIKKDFRMINKQSWDYYQHVYGGGPAIEVQIPIDCANPPQWLETLQLSKVARVNSNYVDMH